jgi:ribosomal protein S27AE
VDKNAFEQIDPLLEEIDGELTELLALPVTEKLRNLLLQVNKAVGNQYVVSLSINVDVFDDKREQSLPLLQTGLTGFNQVKPYKMWNDVSLEKYIVDGEMMMVPHDHCPRCWEIWDFKFKHQTCDHCGATMGKEVKLLLDTDQCPWCRDGKVSMSNPVCDICGFKVDPSQIVWG